jgi:NTE family protein
MARLAVGLALSGGTAKAVTHVGVIKALTEENIPIDYISSTSGGSMVGSLYASGVPLSTVEEIATTMSWRKLVSIKLTRLGFISSERIEAFVTDIIGDVTFEELPIPFAVVATNLVTGQKRTFDSGPVAQAVRASCSIPQIYLPVEIDGEYYVDGGLAEYLPVETLQGMGSEFTIASHLGPVNESYRRPHHILQLVIQVTGLMARKNYVVSKEVADFLVHPNLDRFGAFDFDNSDEMIELGYNTTKALIPELRRQLQNKSSFWARLARRVRG